MVREVDYLNSKKSQPVSNMLLETEKKEKDF